MTKTEISQCSFNSTHLPFRNRYDFGQSDSEPDDAHEMQIDNFGSAQRDFFRNNHDVQIRSHHHIIDGHSTSARIPEVPTVILATANGSFELPSLLGHFFQFAPQYSEPRGARAGEDEHSWMQLQQDIVYACGIHAQDSYQPNRSIAAEKRMLKVSYFPVTKCQLLFAYHGLTFQGEAFLLMSFQLMCNRAEGISTDGVSRHLRLF